MRPFYDNNVTLEKFKTVESDIPIPSQFNKEIATFLILFIDKWVFVSTHYVQIVFKKSFPKN